MWSKVTQLAFYQVGKDASETPAAWSIWPDADGGDGQVGFETAGCHFTQE